jgi:hypothetical protein
VKSLLVGLPAILPTRGSTYCERLMSESRLRLRRGRAGNLTIPDGLTGLGSDQFHVDVTPGSVAATCRESTTEETCAR